MKHFDGPLGGSKTIQGLLLVILLILGAAGEDPQVAGGFCLFGVVSGGVVIVIILSDSKVVVTVAVGVAEAVSDAVDEVGSGGGGFVGVGRLLNHRNARALVVAQWRLRLGDVVVKCVRHRVSAVYQLGLHHCQFSLQGCHLKAKKTKKHNYSEYVFLLCSSNVKFHGSDLLLQCENGGDAAMDWVGQPRLSLVRYRDHCVMPPISRDVQQELRHVARPENLVHRREPCGTLVRPEVWCKYAAAHALPPKELASPTRSHGWWPRRRRVGHH